MSTEVKDRTPALWKPTPADAADWFDKAEVQRSRDYKRPVKKVRLVDSVVGVAFLVLMVVTHAVPELIEAVGVNQWPLQLLLGVALLTVLGSVLSLPESYWMALKHDKKWDLSTQTPKTFWVDQVKDILVSTILLTVVLMPVYWVIRKTDAWWLYGTALLMGVSLLAAFVYPVLIMPIFNKFTPLGDEDLKHRIDAIADQAGVTIKGSFTMDGSKRSRPGQRLRRRVRPDQAGRGLRHDAGAPGLHRRAGRRTRSATTASSTSSRCCRPRCSRR